MTVFLTWLHVVLAPQVQLFCEQNPSEESLLQHHHTLALLTCTSIAWFAFWKHRNEIPLLAGCEEGRMLIWAGSCQWGRVQQSTRGRVVIMNYILNTHGAVLTTNSLHSLIPIWCRCRVVIAGKVLFSGGLNAVSVMSFSIVENYSPRCDLRTVLRLDWIVSCSSKCLILFNRNLAAALLLVLVGGKFLPNVFH